MKTLLLAPELFASEGGIARILRLYLKAACENSSPADSVALVVLNDVQLDSTDLRRYASEQLQDWHACGRNKLPFIRAALEASRDADVLICGHVAQLPVAWLCAQRHRGLKYVLVAHGIEVWRTFSALERFALKRAHRVLCVSDFTRQQLLQRCPLPAERAVVLPNALDPFFQTERAETQSPSSPPILLTISRLCHADRYKGVDHLISALPEIRRRIPGATLHVIGRGDDLPRLQELAAQLGLADAVTFLGQVGDAELSRELSACRVFALPSEREGFGLVYLEAMAHGRPCVGANAGGTPEVITPKCGLLCPFGNVPQLAETCIDALGRAWDHRAIQARAQAFSYAHFRDRLKAVLDA